MNFTQIYNDTLYKIKDIIFDIENIVLIITIIMEIVEKANDKKNNGIIKKQYVLNILNKLLNEIDGISNDTKNEIQYMIDNNIISEIIEMIILASKGKIDINKSINLTSKIFKFIYKLCCLNKKNKIQNIDKLNKEQLNKKSKLRQNAEINLLV